jgi:hypothetical protein
MTKYGRSPVDAAPPVYEHHADSDKEYCKEPPINTTYRPAGPNYSGVAELPLPSPKLYELHHKEISGKITYRPTGLNNSGISELPLQSPKLHELDGATILR